MRAWSTRRKFEGILTSVKTTAKISQRVQASSNKNMNKEKLNFEKFTATGGRFSYAISLNKAGGFSFSSGFCKKHDIAEYPYVVLFYDKKAKAVGFSFLKEATKGAFKLSFTKSKTASVRPNSFIRAYEIKPQLFVGKYEPKKYKTDVGEEIFYIVLEKKK